MHHTEQVEVILKGISKKPQRFMIPMEQGKYIKKTLQNILRAEDTDEESIPAEEVFPVLKDDVKRPALVLRGFRYREQLTQKQLAEKLGIRQHHLSEMENAKRPIGKDMAKKLASVLNANWKAFL